MSYDTTNIFARILREELPCKKICEDANFLAFYTITPLAPVHALIIPKGAFTDAHDFNKNASEEEIVGFYKGVAKVTEILDLHKTGFRQISNCGINGGQEVPHYHIHILGGGKLGSMVSKSID
ncbi:MAG: HIT domain-containing protein [Candidatus Paracaedibacteraceae bacterium]|nr:HIT domain-containing protein [Candidatus Paracaedibacteraceae bacterium]